MNQIFYILSILITLSSCNLITSDKEKVTKNKKLIGFKTVFLSELGDEKYEQLEQELELGETEIKYINDIIYVSYLDMLNACGEYDGNIEIIADTIKLKVDLVSDVVCTSTSIEKITFLVDNPDGKKKQIRK